MYIQFVNFVFLSLGIFIYPHFSQITTAFLAVFDLNYDFRSSLEPKNYFTQRSMVVIYDQDFFDFGKLNEETLMISSYY